MPIALLFKSNTSGFAEIAANRPTIPIIPISISIIPTIFFAFEGSGYGLSTFLEYENLIKTFNENQFLLNQLYRYLILLQIITLEIDIFKTVLLIK
jgi:hypothetical protein